MMVKLELGTYEVCGMHPTHIPSDLAKGFDIRALASFLEELPPAYSANSDVVIDQHWLDMADEYYDSSPNVIITYNDCEVGIVECLFVVTGVALDNGYRGDMPPMVYDIEVHSEYSGGDDYWVTWNKMHLKDALLYMRTQIDDVIEGIYDEEGLEMPEI